MTATPTTQPDPRLEWIAYLPGACNHYGVIVADIGEEAMLVAFGHHDDWRLPIAAFLRHDRVCLGGMNGLTDGLDSPRLTSVRDEITERHASVIREGDPRWPRDWDPECAWGLNWSDPDADDAVPITTWGPA